MSVKKPGYSVESMRTLNDNADDQIMKVTEVSVKDLHLAMHVAPLMPSLRVNALYLDICNKQTHHFLGFPYERNTELLADVACFSKCC